MSVRTLATATAAAAVAAGVTAVLALPSGAAVTVAAPRPPAQATPASASRPAAAGNVGVSVPALVLIRLDAAGHPTAAQTNTGHAPAGSDNWYVLTPGHARTAPAAVRRQVLAAVSHSPASWTAGAWIRLS